MAAQMAKTVDTSELLEKVFIEWSLARIYVSKACGGHT
jgi:hypothetical protein